MTKIKFSYPRRGLTGSFNTFRLGVSLSTLTPGDQVELVDSRSEKLLKRAIVERVLLGPLTQMAAEHAHQAHNWKEYPEAERPALLMASLARRYPVGRVKPESTVTVVYLKEIPDDPETAAELVD